MNLVCPAATGGSLRHGKDGTEPVCANEPLGNTQFLYRQMPPPGSGVSESWKEAAGVFREIRDCTGPCRPDARSMKRRLKGGGKFPAGRCGYYKIQGSNHGKEGICLQSFRK